MNEEYAPLGDFGDRAVDLEKGEGVDVVVKPGKPLPVENGAPLRVRVERQLGYKMPKYVHKIELVSSFSTFGGGRGGYWEDYGYDWYGGI